MSQFWRKTLDHICHRNTTVELDLFTPPLLGRWILHLRGIVSRQEHTSNLLFRKSPHKPACERDCWLPKIDDSSERCFSLPNTTTSFWCNMLFPIVQERLKKHWWQTTPPYTYVAALKTHFCTQHILQNMWCNCRNVSHCVTGSETLCSPTMTRGKLGGKSQQKLRATAAKGHAMRASRD